ncbi:HTH-type transcriptional activator AllS [Vibrio aerogenes CECT 7868]|uniref:HTH-type transcriptional activator AllS n=1 Tax=Vibrio aerogenes CECT 7868 TaxID=1216006 RepID=A0A1M6BVD1_9VIBR|nr:LysR family transcriptional regulator [Vibrio aerogenes]SHI52484.1 HTH-type transcriptional activator AllS [Vibrio aerogenes CECT 7868]
MLMTTLEQWQILKSVVELGSIASAAERHHKSQPAISYQLSQLQERLGIKLLQLKGRKLALTTHGALLLDEVSVLLESWQRMEHKASALKSGPRSFITLVIDSLFPRQQLFSALKQFHQIYPYTQVHLREVVRDEGIAQAEQAFGDLYMIGLTNEQEATTPKQFVMDIRIMLVAHKDHPVFAQEEQLRLLQLNRYPVVQIVDKENQQKQLHEKRYQESWFVTTIDSAVEAVMSGLSCGWLPEDSIRQLLASGELRPIQQNAPSERISSLYLIKDPSCRYDTCVQALSDALLASVTAEN